MNVSALRDARVAIAVLVAAAACSLTYLLVLGTDLSFWLDEWSFLLHRRGLSADAFMAPHNDHIAILHVSIYKVLLAVFGMDSQRPFHVTSLVLFVTSVGVLFTYLLRRIGAWAALAAVLPILFIGTAWDNLLTAFQMAFFVSMAAGVGMLLALGREDRRGDLVACALLAVSVSTSSLGLAFVIAGAVHVAWSPARWRRAYVVAIPAAIYALWWLGWGHEAQSAVSFHNIATAPGYVLDGFAGSLASLFGLTETGALAPGPSLQWGRPLLAAGLIAAGARVAKLGGIPRDLAVVLALGIGFWWLAAANAGIFREADNGRYQYMGAVIVLLIAGELLRGVRIRTRALVAVYALVAVSIASGVYVIYQGWEGLRGVIERERGALTGLELARDTVDPSFAITEENAGGLYGDIDAASYLSAVDAYGSPAFSETELLAAPEASRVTADTVLADALGISLEPGVASVSAAGGCERVRLGEGEPPSLELAPGSTEIRTSRRASVRARLRRFATTSHPVELGELPPGGGAVLDIPADRSSAPWHLELSGAGRASVCQLRG